LCIYEHTGEGYVRSGFRIRVEVVSYSSYPDRARVGSFLPQP
jgi:hypothetical protein